MSKKIKPPTEKEFNTRANSIAREFCPRIYACKKCGWPVVNGYCCRTCGDGAPYEAAHGIKGEA